MKNCLAKQKPKLLVVAAATATNYSLQDCFVLQFDKLLANAKDDQDEFVMVDGRHLMSG